MAELPRITFVTGNKNKIREVTEILQGIAIVDAEKLDLPEPQGDQLEIAREKALTAYARLQRPCLIEDTSLCFHALGDLPGPYIKWFYEKIGNEGLHKMLAGFEDKSGHALCLFTVAEGPNPEDCKFYAGRLPGTIVAPRGTSGFGWDPIFQPQGSNLTFAEMGPEAKNEFSHRRLALNELVKRFKDETPSAEVPERKRDRDA